MAPEKLTHVLSSIDRPGTRRRGSDFGYGAVMHPGDNAFAEHHCRFERGFCSIFNGYENFRAAEIDGVGSLLHVNADAVNVFETDRKIAGVIAEGKFAKIG